MTAEIIIAIHKPCTIPKELSGDNAYIPLFVGAVNKKSLYIKDDEVIRPEGEIPDGFLPLRRDDEGENISDKNPGYSELTGLYWLYKNSKADVNGLVHYRRYFKGLDGSKIESIFQSGADIIVPKKRNYFIETLYSHYAHTLDARHLDLALSVIKDEYPEYESAAVSAYSRTWGYMFNMTVMKREVFQSYCAFLFEVLSALEKRGVSKESDTAFEKRLYGRVSEILFNVWLLKNNGYSLKEIPVVSQEKTNWLKKGTAFLSAKFFGKKYRESF